MQLKRAVPCRSICIGFADCYLFAHSFGCISLSLAECLVDVDNRVQRCCMHHVQIHAAREQTGPPFKLLKSLSSIPQLSPMINESAGPAAPIAADTLRKFSSMASLRSSTSSVVADHWFRYDILPSEWDILWLSTALKLLLFPS